MRHIVESLPKLMPLKRFVGTGRSVVSQDFFQPVANAQTIGFLVLERNSGEPPLTNIAVRFVATAEVRFWLAGRHTDDLFDRIALAIVQDRELIDALLFPVRPFLGAPQLLIELFYRFDELFTRDTRYHRIDPPHTQGCPLFPLKDRALVQYSAPSPLAHLHFDRSSFTRSSRDE